MTKTPTTLKDTDRDQGCVGPKVLMSSASRRRVAQELAQAKLSVTRACQIAGLSRAAYYKRPQDAATRDTAVIETLNGLIQKHGRWGFWKCYSCLRLNGHPWNHKKVYRVYCAMNLNLRRRTKKRLPDRPRQSMDTSKQINECWSLSFLHDSLYRGITSRTLDAIDGANREYLRIEAGTSFPTTRLIRSLGQLIHYYGKPMAIRLGNGPKTKSQRFVDWANEQEIRIRYIQSGKPNQTGFVKRFNRTYRDEVPYAHVFQSLDQAQTITNDWLKEYNEFRPHEFLGNIPPAQCIPRRNTTPRSLQCIAYLTGKLTKPAGII